MSGLALPAFIAAWLLAQAPSAAPDASAAPAPPRRPDAPGEAAASRSAAARRAALLRAALASDPPVEQLRAAATALALAEPGRARSLLERARLAGWLPEIRGRLDRRYARTESLDLAKSAVDPVATPVGLDTNNDLRYEWRATWDLSRIVFNPDEIAASAQGLRLADARRELEAQVIRLYFERRRLKAESFASDGTDTASALRMDIRIQEIEAELDALTGGAFSRLRAARGGAAFGATP